MLEYDEFTYEYDANGSLLRRTAKSDGSISAFVWSALNQLVEVRLPNGGVVNCQYDGLGRRIEKTVNGVTQQFVYDGRDVVLVTDGANQLETRFIRGTLPEQLLAMQARGQTYFFHTDQIGSVRQVTDAAGQVVGRMDYDAFGRVNSREGSVQSPFGFAAKWLAEETGLLRIGARYYSPTLGRFISPDPAGLGAGELNLYEYANNHPVALTDTTGLNVVVGFSLAGGGGNVILGPQSFQIQSAQGFGSLSVSGKAGFVPGFEKPAKSIADAVVESGATASVGPFSLGYSRKQDIFGKPQSEDGGFKFKPPHRQESQRHTQARFPLPGPPPYRGRT